MTTEPDDITTQEPPALRTAEDRSLLVRYAEVGYGTGKRVEDPSQELAVVSLDLQVEEHEDLHHFVFRVEDAELLARGLSMAVQKSREEPADGADA